MERESVRYPQLIVRMSLSVPPGPFPLAVRHTGIGMDISYAFIIKFKNGKTGDFLRVS